MIENKKGITVTSITVYIILFFMFTTIITIISSSFNEDLFKDRGTAINITGVNKLEYNLLKSAYESNDSELEMEGEKNVITFSNGDIYSFDLEKHVVYKNGGKLISFLKDVHFKKSEQLLNITVKLNKYTSEIERTISINTNTNMSYVDNGLIAHYDGVNNTGTGRHDNKVNTWEDISGNGATAVANVTFVNDGITSGWTKNGFIFPKETEKTYFTATHLSKKYPSMTFEIVITPITELGDSGTDYIRPIEIINVSGALSLRLYSRLHINLMYGSGHNTIFEKYNTPALTKDMCHTITFVQDDLTTRSIYVNGEYMFSYTNLSLIEIDFTKLLMKSSSRGSFIMHSVRVYGRNLNKEEVLKNYQMDSALYRE